MGTCAIFICMCRLPLEKIASSCCLFHLIRLIIYTASTFVCWGRVKLSIHNYVRFMHHFEKSTDVLNVCELLWRGMTRHSTSLIFRQNFTRLDFGILKLIRWTRLCFSATSFWKALIYPQTLWVVGSMFLQKCNSFLEMFLFTKLAYC